MDRHRIIMPADFHQRCMAARTAGEAVHEVLWQTLRTLQTADERRQQRNQPKLFPWLTTAKHINKTSFSRMRVGLAIAVLCGGKGQMMADVLQVLRYEGGL